MHLQDCVYAPRHVAPALECSTSLGQACSFKNQKSIDRKPFVYFCSSNVRMCCVPQQLGCSQCARTQVGLSAVFRVSLGFYWAPNTKANNHVRTRS